MQVLCHDFGAKRAFLLKAAGPAKLLIYFQDFRSFSNPGIRRFLTDLDPSPLLHPDSLLSSTLFVQPPPSTTTCACFLTLVMLASAVCQLEPFLFQHIYTHTHAQVHTDISFKYGTLRLSHACLDLSVESCGQEDMEFTIAISK